MLLSLILNVSNSFKYECFHGKNSTLNIYTRTHTHACTCTEVRQDFYCSLLQGNKTWVSETVGFYGNRVQDWVNAEEKKGLFLSIVMGVFWHMAGPVFSFSLRGFREITRKDPVTFSRKVEAPNSFAAAAAASPEPSRRRKQLLCCLRNVFQSTKKTKEKRKTKQMKDFVYAAGGRTQCPSLTTAWFLCLRRAPVVGCCSVMTLVP